VGVKFSDPDQTGLEAHPAAFKTWARNVMGTRFFLLVQMGSKVNLVSYTLDIVFLSQGEALTTLLLPSWESADVFLYLHCASIDILRDYLTFIIFN
jgi:hypothetical protein